MSLRVRLAEVLEPAIRLLVVGVVAVAAALVPVGAAGGISTTPSPAPLWKAYPLNGGQPRAKPSPTPASRTPAQHRSRRLRLVLEIVATLAGILAVCWGIVVYLRSREDRRPAASRPRGADERAVPPPTADIRPPQPLRTNDRPRRTDRPRPVDRPRSVDRPRPVEVEQPRSLLGPRGREVVSDLLETLGGGAFGTTTDAELVLVLCERLRSATVAGDVEWDHSGAERFVCERAPGSVVISSRDDAERRYELVVHDWNGAQLDDVRSPMPDGGKDAARLTDALAGLYAVARDSASRIYEPIDTLIDALRGSARRP